MKELNISLGYELNINTFEIFLTELLKKSLKQFSSFDTIIFDMSKLKFVKTGGLISFLSLCGAIKEKKIFSNMENIKIYLELPSDKILEHLHWMQFFKLSYNYEWIENCRSLSQKDNEYYEKWIGKLTRYRNEIDPIKKKSYRAKIFPIRYLPLLGWSDFDNACMGFVNVLIDVFEPILGYDLNFSKEQRRQFWESNKEIFKNIYDHSKSWGIVAIQRDKIRNNIVFSYSDIGIGIRNSMDLFLRTKYKLNEIDDDFAIREAIKKGVSSKEIDFKKNCNNIGKGLYIVDNYIKDTNGSFIIRSGKGFYSRNIDNVPKVINYFPGTQIHIAIPKK